MESHFEWKVITNSIRKQANRKAVLSGENEGGPILKAFKNRSNKNGTYIKERFPEVAQNWASTNSQAGANGQAAEQVAYVKKRHPEVTDIFGDFSLSFVWSRFYLPLFLSKFNI